MQLLGAAEFGPLAAELDEVAPEAPQAGPILPRAPSVKVVPLGVGAVRVVVAVLRVAILVAHQNHRNTLHACRARCIQHTRTAKNKLCLNQQWFNRCPLVSHTTARCRLENTRRAQQSVETEAVEAGRGGHLG